MKITKFGQSCLLVEEGGARILLDPGVYSTGFEALTGLNALLITHEHPDHFTVETVNAVIKNNPTVVIYTNQGIVDSLQKEGINAKALEEGEIAKVEDVTIEGIGQQHAIMHPSMPTVSNTGYMIAEKLFCPGDALTIPAKPVEILALPVAAPWMRISEGIDYALQVKPKVAFAIHDANVSWQQLLQRYYTALVEPQYISFVMPEIGKTYEY